MRPSGLEPPRRKFSTRPSTLRVIIPPRAQSRRAEPRAGGAGRPCDEWECSSGAPGPTTATATASFHRGTLSLRNMFVPGHSDPKQAEQGAEETWIDQAQQEIFDFIHKTRPSTATRPRADIGKAVGLGLLRPHAHLSNLEKIGPPRRDRRPRAIELLDRAVGTPWRACADRARRQPAAAGIGGRGRADARGGEHRGLRLCAVGGRGGDGE